VPVESSHALTVWLWEAMYSRVGRWEASTPSSQPMTVAEGNVGGSCLSLAATSREEKRRAWLLSACCLPTCALREEKEKVKYWRSQAIK
jgi:hypothetical protein